MHKEHSELDQSACISLAEKQRSDKTAQELTRACEMLNQVHWPRLKHTNPGEWSWCYITPGSFPTICFTPEKRHSVRQILSDEQRMLIEVIARLAATLATYVINNEELHDYFNNPKVT